MANLDPEPPLLEAEAAAWTPASLIAKIIQPPPMPATIQVVGAGLAEANGTYTLSTSPRPFGPASRYTKSGTMMGGSVTFAVWTVLVPVGRNRSRQTWLLGAEQEPSESTPMRSFGTLYVSTDDPSTETHLPSRFGWVANPLYILDIAYPATDPVPIIVHGMRILDWRVDSNSDWRIVVRYELAGQSRETEYHVHKSTLKSGMYSSAYFAGAFATALSGNAEQASTFDFHYRVAEQMPVFLDFVYRGELRITHRNAIILHYLADYFRCDALLWKVQSFLDKDNISFWSLANCGAIYKQAKDLAGFGTMYLQAVENFCRVHLDYTFPWLVDDLIREAPLSFWVRIFLDADINGANSAQISTFMNRIFCEHKAELDGETFFALSSKLSTIAVHAASSLIGLELGFMEPSASNRSILTALQDKCIDVLAADYRLFGHDELPDETPPFVWKALLGKKNDIMNSE